MEEATIKAFRCKPVLALLLVSMLSGCSGIPGRQVASSPPDEAGRIRSLEPAASWSPLVLGGMYPIGNPNARYASPSYVSAVFRRLNVRVNQAYSVLAASPQKYTNAQLFALSGAVADLIRYVDAIESRPSGAGWGGLRPAASYASGVGHLHIMESQGLVAQSAGAPQLKAAMIQSFIDMAAGEALKQLGSPTAYMLELVERQLVAQGTREVIAAAPVIGSLLAAGMLAEGRTLDGSKMPELDYVALKAVARPGPATADPGLDK